MFGTNWYCRLDLPGVKEFVADLPEDVPGHGDPGAGQRLLQRLHGDARAAARGRAGRHDQQHHGHQGARGPQGVGARPHADFDAYMDPATHQLQQTIYMATLQRRSRRRRTTSSRSSPRRCRRTSMDKDAPAACKLEPYERADAELRARERPSAMPESRDRCASARPRPDGCVNLLPHLVNGVCARAPVRADRARLHADRRRDGDDQPRARLAVRARHVCRALRSSRRSRGWLPEIAGVRTSRCRSARATRSRCSSRRSSSACSACCSSSCMRRTYGKDPLYGLLLTFGAALVIEEAIRAGLGLDARSSCRCPRRSPARFMLGDLIYRALPLLRRARSPALVHRPALALPREDALRRDHQGRRARQRDGARARHQPVAAAPLRVRARRRRWRRSPAS